MFPTKNVLKVLFFIPIDRRNIENHKMDERTIWKVGPGGRVTELFTWKASVGTVETVAVVCWPAHLKMEEGLEPQRKLNRQSKGVCIS